MTASTDCVTLAKEVGGGLGAGETVHIISFKTSTVQANGGCAPLEDSSTLASFLGRMAWQLL